MLALAASALALSSCGYALAGRGSFLPAYIQTIGIPVFVNNTAVFDAEQLLTARVRQEFIARGKYKVIPEASGADAVLRGEIASITLTPSGFNADNQATRYIVQVVMRISLRDLKTDKVIWENPSLVYREEFDIVSNTGSVLDPNAFFGQGGNALERMATEFARTVVSSLLEGF
jgi:hypothetical protein